MEKLLGFLAKLSYWLGVACIILAVVSKVLNSLGAEFGEVMTRGNDVGYHSFVTGAVLFFLMAIATASFDSVNKRGS